MSGGGAKEVLLIGDSQAASIIKAERNGLYRAENFTMTYFVAPGLRLRKIILDDDKILPHEAFEMEFMKEYIDLSTLSLQRFDAVFVLSHLLRASAIMAKSFYGFYPFSSQDEAERLAAQEGEHAPSLASDLCLFKTAKGALKATAPIALAKRLRASTRARVFIIQPPNFAKPAIRSEKFGPALSYLDQIGFCAGAGAIYRAALEEICAEMDWVRPVFQPEITIENGLFTKEAFTKESFRLMNLDAAQPKTDFEHSNLAYGTLMLEVLDAVMAEDGLFC